MKFAIWKLWNYICFVVGKKRLSLAETLRCNLMPVWVHKFVFIAPSNPLGIVSNYWVYITVCNSQESLLLTFLWEGNTKTKNFAFLKLHSLCTKVYLSTLTLYRGSPSASFSLFTYSPTAILVFGISVSKRMSKKAYIIEFSVSFIDFDRKVLQGVK